MEFSMSDHCDKEPIKESILLRPFLIFLFKHTGKSYSEALILALVNPQYDKRFFIELPEEYKFITCFAYKKCFFLYLYILLGL